MALVCPLMDTATGCRRAKEGVLVGVPLTLTAEVLGKI